MPELTLTEYKPARYALSQDDCDALRTCVRDLTVEPAAGHPGSYDLTPGSLVGAVRVGDLAVVIRPKIEIDRLLFLLAYGLDPKTWGHSPFALDKEASVVEAVTLAFVHHVKAAVRRGLLHAYRHEADRLSVVRGRLDLNAFVSRRFGLAPPVDVTFDEFTTDHLLNQLLKAALRRLERSPLRSAHARRQLHAVLPLFENVQAVHFDGRQLPSALYTRLNRHYRPAVELARLILASTTFENRHGSVQATSFLVDMNVVFETFLFEALQEQLGGPASFVRGRSLRLDEGARVPIVPDLSWWHGQDAIFVGDAKYKALKVKGYENADLYQLLAYVTALDLPTGLLVYASGELQPGAYRVRHADKSLEVRYIDLAGTPAQILESVGVVASRVREMRDATLRYRSASRTQVAQVVRTRPMPAFA